MEFKLLAAGLRYNVVTELSFHHSQDAQAIAIAARTILDGTQSEIYTLSLDHGVFNAMERTQQAIMSIAQTPLSSRSSKLC